MLTTASPLYDPTHYNMGAVWPFVTGFLALGHYEYGRPWAGYPLIDALARVGLDFGRGRFPELLSGAYYRPLDTAVPQQFFASSMLASPVAFGLLGWEPDAPRGRARLAPQLPPQWSRVRVRGLAAGSARVDAELESRAEGLSARLSAAGGPIVVDFRPSPPEGARGLAVRVDGRAIRTAADGSVPIRLDGRERVVEAEWSGGLAIEPPVVELVPGQSDAGVRVLAFEAAAGGWRLAVEGRSGTEIALRLHGRVSRADGAALRPAAGATELVIALPKADAAFSRAEVQLR